MKTWIFNNKLTIIGVVLGAIGGFIYWQQIGCVSGTCPITSSWFNSTAYGALMGGLLFSLFKQQKKENPRRTEG
ncbi:MAG: hypothetical protein FJY19_02550 [Bacteroidetes bacterium]|nr:hypothetical protein [Bacteroidota bacterium]